MTGYVVEGLMDDRVVEGLMDDRVLEGLMVNGWKIVR